MKPLKSPPYLVDTHCHLDLIPIRRNLPFLLSEGGAAGIGGWIVPAVNPDGWQRIAELARQFPQVFPAFGIHPMFADKASIDDLKLLERLAPQGVAIGEVGLDRRCRSPERQLELLQKQIEIAQRSGKPLLIHSVKSGNQLLQLLQQNRKRLSGGIMHGFSGSLEMARRFMELGFKIALGGTLLLKNAVRSVQVAKELPIESLALETDAPFMVDRTDMKGGNPLLRLLAVARQLQDIRGVPSDLLIGQSYQNVVDLFPEIQAG